MTGLVIKRTPSMKEKLKKLQLQLQSGAEPSGAKPKEAKPSILHKPKPKTRFLPGESRSTVGSEGFRDLHPDTYGRSITRNIRRGQGGITEQDLNPPRLTAHINIGGEQFSAWELDCAQRTNLVQTHWTKHREAYIAKFLLNVLTAEYTIWRLGQWTYSQLTHQVSPKRIEL